MTCYESITLGLQIISTLISIIGLIAIFYAKAALDLAKKDFTRTFKIQSEEYAAKKIQHLFDIKDSLDKIERNEFNYDENSQNNQFHLNYQLVLNLLEALAIDNKIDKEKALYDVRQVNFVAINFVSNIKGKLLDYIKCKRFEDEAPNLWENAEAWIENPPV